MNNHLLRIAATLASLAAFGTLPPATATFLMESAMTPFVADSVPGKWFHDTQDGMIRGFYRFMDDGRTAVVMIGSYF